jgi:hypothetical protein
VQVGADENFSLVDNAKQLYPFPFAPIIFIYWSFINGWEKIKLEEVIGRVGLSV